MPKIAKELTALEVKHLPVGTHAVGGVKGLYLRKKTTTSGHYFLRYLDSQGRHDFILGSFATVSLAKARALAFTAREKVDRGECPIAEREAKKKQVLQQVMQFNQKQHPDTFEKIANEWIEDRAHNGFWKNNDDGEKDTRRILQLHVFPFLGSLEIENITAENIRDCLTPIWQSKPATAKKAKTYINKVLQWAIALHKRSNEVNPASMQGALGVLMESLQVNKKTKLNHAACAVKDLPSLMIHIHGMRSFSARAAEFAILTAARSQAVRLAQWREFNLKKGIWMIPLEHDKVKTVKRDRTIFLSPQAIALLQSLPRIANNPWVFPNTHGDPLSDMALNVFLRGLHEQKKAQDGIGWIDPTKTARTGKESVITIHGTARATFRTWAKDDELGNNRRFDQEAVELCLLHAKNDAYDGAYDRAPLAKERQRIMHAWGEYCTSLLPHS